MLTRMPKENTLVLSDFSEQWRKGSKIEVADISEQMFTYLNKG